MRETFWRQPHGASTSSTCNRLPMSNAMKSQTNTNDSTQWTATIRSHGIGNDALIAVPMGLLLLFGGIAALIEHYSVFTSVVAVLVLTFAGVTLASCAYSLWGTCFVSVDAGGWSVTRSLWRRRSTV